MINEYAIHHQKSLYTIWYLKKYWYPKIGAILTNLIHFLNVLFMLFAIRDTLCSIGYCWDLKNSIIVYLYICVMLDMHMSAHATKFCKGNYFNV